MLAGGAGTPDRYFVFWCYPAPLETSWCTDKFVQKVTFLPMFEIILDFHQTKTTQMKNLII